MKFVLLSAVFIAVAVAAPTSNAQNEAVDLVKRCQPGFQYDPDTGNCWHGGGGGR